MNREPHSPAPEQPSTLAAEAERSFFARRSSQETLVVSGATRVFSPIQRALEATITFGILILVALSTANSIYIANWVEDMPDLRVTATAGVLLALVLGRARRIRMIGAMLIGFVVGGLIVMAQITQLETLGGQPLFWDRFTDFGFRFQDWFNQAFSSGLTTDNLPFVFFTDVFVFIASFLGAYAVARWRNPWVAMILLGALLAVNVSYLSDRQWNLSYGFFLTGAMLLLMRASLLRRMDRWRSQGSAYPDWISLSFLGATMLAVVLLLTLSRVIPRPDESQALEDAWAAIAEPFEGLNDDFRRLFSGIDSRRGVPVHSFDDFLVMQGDIDPGDAIIMRAAATEPGLLRGAVYDEYTGRGWRQSPSTSRTVRELEPISGTEPTDDTSIANEATVVTSDYLDRRPVAAQISVERSPAVLFSFGAPVLANKDTRVDTLASVDFEVDFSDAARFAGTDLEPALDAIADRIAAGNADPDDDIDAPSADEVATYVPVQYSLIDVDVDSTSGLPVGLMLRSNPEETDVLSLRPLQRRVRAGFTYQITGTVSGANEQALATAGDDYPLWVTETFLQLPEYEEEERANLDRLLSTIAGSFALAPDPERSDGGYNPYSISAAVETYLRSAPAVDEDGRIVRDDDGEPVPLYPLTTEIELPPAKSDAVYWFLFENLEDGLPIGGYYDYHASSMVVLLRVAGVPARIATGFVLSANNYDDRTQNYIVRGHDSYAWVEVYFPNYGWVDFDPTPSTSADETLASIAGGAAGARRIAAQRLTTPRFDLRPGTGGDPLSDLDLTEILQYLADGTIPGEDALLAQGASRWYWLGPTIAASILFAVLLLLRIGWWLSLRGLEPTARLWVSASRLARWIGVRADPSTTPQEHARAIDNRLGLGDLALDLADRYTATRFGRKSLSDEQEAETIDNWKRLRSSMIRLALRLPVRPPASTDDELDSAAPAPAGD
ncbi:MAG: transglutaminaseTgpA domain-containing protein [Chloroflexi bacterium]|nr:transglutaminaseTgpA domain-containing protein [Chloroflexota bacterium]MCY3695774.1 transglutaminaseTgpA domain-containing protein [Chloroflexota bacterium]